MGNDFVVTDHRKESKLSLKETINKNPDGQKVLANPTNEKRESSKEYEEQVGSGQRRRNYKCILA